MAELDRLITLTIDTGGMRMSGIYTPVNVTVTVWARRTDTGADRLLETSGSRGQARRTYRLRWRQDLVDAVEAGRQVNVVEDGHTLNSPVVVTVAEPEGTRRRWLDLTVEGTT